MKRMKKEDLMSSRSQSFDQGSWIKVGMSTCGIAAGAAKVYETIGAELKQHGSKFELRQCGCIGMCSVEPLVEVCVAGQAPVMYEMVDVELAKRIVTEHVAGNKPAGSPRKSSEFNNGQLRVALRNCGVVNPEDINEYLARDGYQALRKCLFDYKPEQIIDEIKLSGLRGRGGGGFPTWRKWSFARASRGTPKYIICNGDEGDPGAYMDRSVMEGDPHSLIEGMTIAGIAIGAEQGFFYIRAEYPLAVERVEKAIKDARALGLLGQNILNSGINFDLEVRLGAGAFVCGEETALIASLEGKRGTPRPRPPFPAVSGLWGSPTIINNVETLANIPPILAKGGAWYSSIGTEKSKGTKVFAVTGKVANAGLVEIPMGMTLRQVVFDICGGVANGKRILAVQTGGPSGGVITEEYLDTPITYENLQQLGSIMGSGGMIVMDEDDCIVDIAKFYLGFCVEESCGKCSPCRIGGTRMLEILERICEGKGKESDMDLLRQTAQAMKLASLCGLGQTAPNPILSTLRYFEKEYRQHIHDKKCRAGVCSQLMSYRIVDEACKRCGLCAKRCPVGAITGDRKTGFVIDQVKCIKCGACMEACKFDAIVKE